ncbi:hypothetical protein Tco_1464622, partial [Tanacetum coccineum]
VSAGIEGVSESSTSSQQDQDCIVMPIWKDASYFDNASFKSVADAQIQDQDGTHDDCCFQDNGIDDKQVNTASPQVNTGSRELSTADYEVNTATSEDSQEEDQGIDLGNISPSYAVSSTPHTRIHKDHPIDHVIGDVQSFVQTRRMMTSYSELGFLGAIYEGKTRPFELLVYVQDTCPIAVTPSTKKVVISPINKVKKVRFAEPLTSSSNIKQVESSNTSDSNTPVLSSTGVNCSTSNYESKPQGCPDYTQVSGLRMFETHDRESLSAHELCQ